jgi:hypothetical protein
MVESPLLENSGQATATEIKEYMTLNGELGFLAYQIRFDIAYSVNRLARFNQNPLKEARAA